MGYTHYWYREEKLNPEKFKAASEDCKKVTDWLSQLKNFRIQYEYDLNEPPVFTGDLVRFNGVADEGHETFLMEQRYTPSYSQLHDDGKLFNFCKTAYKSYDVAVTACLIVFKHHFGEDIRISSDGSVRDWQEGLKACQECLGYGEVPFSGRE